MRKRESVSLKRRKNVKAYSIFDDFTQEALDILAAAGVETTVHPLGIPRPGSAQMKEILEEYDCVIIGTSQKITEDMFENVTAKKIIATASVGVDHIRVPEAKKELITVLNTPGANTQSVAEYNVGAMLLARKRFLEGNSLYTRGLDNKKLVRKPEDIQNTTVGFVGAGRISTRTMELLRPFGVNLLCHSDDADQRRYLVDDFGVRFVSLEELAERSDIISVNVPGILSTNKLISRDVISRMKSMCIFVSISRESVVDLDALFEKADENPNFYAILDLDVIPEYTSKNNFRNIVLTPHIAGGTIESRKRMFLEAAEAISMQLKKQ